MNSQKILLERILLNMKYDSKKTLTENKIANNLLLEQQEIPITMNQTMQFQIWVWKNIDKLGNPDNADKNKKYNTSLCDQPCTPYTRNIGGRLYAGAIDGYFGGKTQKLWNTYKTTYKKANPTWNQQDIKTDEKVLGQSIPTTIVQAKNFQKWFLEHKEKAKKDSKGLYTTKLCSTLCTYSQAVDGIYGGKTKTLWETYGDEYKKLNNLWSVSQEWSVESQQAEDLKKERSDLAKIFRWSVANPSGWDGVSAIPDAIDVTNTVQKAKLKPEQCPYYTGWDLSNTTFPKPRKYTDEELKKLYVVTGGDSAYVAKLAEKNKADTEFVLNSSSNEGARMRGDYNQISDRLGYDRYVADPSGVGDTAYGKRWKEHSNFWYGELEKSKNKIYEDATKWNKEYDTVSSELNTKCSTPMKFCGRGMAIDESQKNCIYISYSDVCRKAGGVWVYNAGKNNAWCGCRSMLSQDLTWKGKEFPASNYYEFNGPEEKFTANIVFHEAMEWQTPGTGANAIAKKEERHHALFAVEMTLMGIGFMTGPIGPLFMGAAAIVGAVDGILYYQEGDKHMGVMMISLALLGIPEVAAAFRLVKAELKAIEFISKYGDDAFKTFIETAVKNPELLGEADRALLKSLQNATYLSQAALGAKMSQKIAQNFVKELPSFAKKQGLGWKEFARIFWNFAEKNPTIKGIIIYVAGVPYTIDQVYLAKYGNDNDRQKSAIASLFDYLNVSGAKVEQQLLDAALLSFTATIQQDAQFTQEANKFLEKLNNASGGSAVEVKLNINALMSEDAVVEKFRKMGMVQSGFDENRYNELVKKQMEKEKELREKEGCSKLSVLQELVKESKWEETNKIDYTKLRLNNPDELKIEEIRCGEKDYYFKEFKLTKMKTLPITKIETKPQQMVDSKGNPIHPSLYQDRYSKPQ